MVRRLLTGSSRSPGAAFALAVALTGALGAAAARVHHRYEIEDFFPTGTPERIAYERAEEAFGRDDRTGLLVAEAPATLDVAAFQALDAVTRRLADAPEIEKVASPTSTELTSREGEDVRLERAVPLDQPLTAARVAEVLDRYRAPPYARTLVSDDHRVAVIAATLRPDRLGFASRAALLERLRGEAAALGEAGFTCHVAGYPIQRVLLARTAARESGRFLPATLAVIVILAALTFRSLAAVVAILAITAGATVWTTGLMVLTGLPPNIFGPAVYVMVAVVGVADPVHLLARQRELMAEGLDATPAHERAWAEVGGPCFLASLTTAMAFATLALTGIPLVAQMGLQVAMGVGAAFALTWLLLPTLAPWIPAPTAAPGTGALARTCAAADRLVARRPGVVLGIALAAGAVAAVAARGLSTNAPFLADLAPDHPVRVANRALERDLSGVIPLDVVIDPPAGKPRSAAFAAARMRKVEELTARLRNLDGVAWSTSAVDTLRQLGRLLARVPDDEVPGLLPTAFLLAYDQVRPWADDKTGRTRIRLRLEDLNSDAAFALFDRIRQACAETLPAGEVVHVTGQGYLAQVVNRQIVRHFRLGFAVALLGVALVLALLVRDPVLALASVVPNLLPVVGVAGLMAVTGVELRYTSALVLATVFGLAVDDTLHVLTQLRRCRDAEDPVSVTLRIAGPGLILTSVLLAAGFSVLGLSSFLPLRVMGGLLAVTSALALAGDLLVLPALIRLLRRRSRASTAHATDP